MYVGALEAHVVEDGCQSWIRGGIDHVVRHLGIVGEFIVEAHAVGFQRGARAQMDTGSEVTLVFERFTGAAPPRSVTTQSGTEQIELFGRELALFADSDVFGEDDLDRPI